MTLNQDFYYWKLIHELVLNKEYRLIHILEDHSEVWLQPYKLKEFQLVRLKRHDVDWGNWLAHDIEEAAKHFEQVRLSSMHRSMNVLNIYVSTYPPVDDFEHYITDPFLQGKTAIKTFFISSDEINQKTNELEKVLSTSLSNIFEHSNEADHEYISKLKHEIVHSSSARVKEERQLFNHGRPLFTYAFLVIQVLLFILLEISGGSTNNETLIKFGAKENSLILEGEWWRFLTPIFLHIGFVHLLLNSFALYYIGATVERMFGRVRFLFIYLFAGLTGSIASFAFSPFISAGASGAIFGCFGALLYLGIVQPKLFFRTLGSNIIVVIGINLAIGFVVPNIDNAGHIGGLVGGFTAALLLQLPKYKHIFLRIIGLVGVIVLPIGLFIFGSNQSFSDQPEFVMTEASKLIENNEVEEAYEMLLKASNNEDAPAEIYYLLSFTEIGLGFYDSAINHLQITLQKNQDFHQAYYYLAILYYEKNDPEAAKSSISKAIELDPENEDYKLLQEDLNL